MSRRRRPNRHTAQADGFWGRTDGDAAAPRPIRPTHDPGAIPRSLGDPPLPPNPTAAQNHLAAVYEEAVRAATALLAANSLLADFDEPAAANSRQ